MPTIVYPDLAAFRQQTVASAWPAVTLICGEEMLCEKALDAILDAIIDEADRPMGLERFDGGEAPMGAVLSSLNTFAMLTRGKVVVLQDARIFHSAQAKQGLREKMIQAAQRGETKKAARTMLALMALHGMRVDDMDEPDPRRRLIGDGDGEPPAWLASLVAYCRENALTVPTRQDDGDLLGTAMETGFPEGHRLILTTDVVDRRKALFKAIVAKGLVVDCTVPQGASQADRNAQGQVMHNAIGETLAGADVRMADDARQRLIELTGFDLRTIVGNLEKLISYVGDRRMIRASDVAAVLSRSRRDPVFAFTNALGDRNLPAALACMQGLLDDGMHPLQLLAAAANQVRRLLLAKAFILRDGGRHWSDRMTYAGFKTGPFQAVKADDKALAAVLERWDAMGRPTGASPSAGKTSPSDMQLSGPSKSPYPVFQTLKKADAFALDELAAAMADLSDADRRIKTTGRDPRLVLEAVLMRLCRRAHDGRPGDRRNAR